MKNLLIPFFLFFLMSSCRSANPLRGDQAALNSAANSFVFNPPTEPAYVDQWGDDGFEKRNGRVHWLLPQEYKGARIEWSWDPSYGFVDDSLFEDDYGRESLKYPFEEQGGKEVYLQATFSKGAYYSSPRYYSATLEGGTSVRPLLQDEARRFARESRGLVRQQVNMGQRYRGRDFPLSFGDFAYQWDLSGPAANHVRIEGSSLVQRGARPVGAANYQGNLTLTVYHNDVPRNVASYTHPNSFPVAVQFPAQAAPNPGRRGAAPQARNPVRRRGPAFQAQANVQGHFVPGGQVVGATPQAIVENAVERATQAAQTRGLGRIPLATTMAGSAYRVTESQTPDPIRYNSSLGQVKVIFTLEGFGGSIEFLSPQRAYYLYRKKDLSDELKGQWVLTAYLAHGGTTHTHQGRVPVIFETPADYRFREQAQAPDDAERAATENLTVLASRAIEYEPSPTNSKLNLEKLVRGEALKLPRSLEVGDNFYQVSWKVTEGKEGLLEIQDLEGRDYIRGGIKYGSIAQNPWVERGLLNFKLIPTFTLLGLDAPIEDTDSISVGINPLGDFERHLMNAREHYGPCYIPNIGDHWLKPAKYKDYSDYTYVDGTQAEFHFEFDVFPNRILSKAMGFCREHVVGSHSSFAEKFTQFRGEYPADGWAETMSIPAQYRNQPLVPYIAHKEGAGRGHPTRIRFARAGVGRDDEVGIDAGGPRKEFFSEKLANSLKGELDPTFKPFVPVKEGSTIFAVNPEFSNYTQCLSPDSTARTPEQRESECYRNIGRVLAWVILEEGQFTPIHFTSYTVEKMMDLDPPFSDQMDRETKYARLLGLAWLEVPRETPLSSLEKVLGVNRLVIDEDTREPFFSFMNLGSFTVAEEKKLEAELKAARDAAEEENREPPEEPTEEEKLEAIRVAALEAAKEATVDMLEDVFALGPHWEGRANAVSLENKGREFHEFRYDIAIEYLKHLLHRPNTYTIDSTEVERRPDIIRERRLNALQAGFTGVFRGKRALGELDGMVLTPKDIARRFSFSYFEMNSLLLSAPLTVTELADLLKGIQARGALSQSVKPFYVRAIDRIAREGTEEEQKQILSGILFAITGSRVEPSDLATNPLKMDTRAPTVLPNGQVLPVPATHTCFNTIDIPAGNYSVRGRMQQYQWTDELMYNFLKNLSNEAGGHNRG